MLATTQEESAPLDSGDFQHKYLKDQFHQEAEQQYAHKVHIGRPVKSDQSQIDGQSKADLSLVFSQTGTGSLGNPKLQPSSDNVLLKEGFRKCESCGSILPSTDKAISKDSTKSNLEGQNELRNPLRSPGQTDQSAHLGDDMLARSFALTKNLKASAASQAEDQISAFGKLRRRSRKGESRAETGHGPYVRGQELLAQRRNSRTRPSMDETSGGLLKRKPVRGVTFAIDHSLPMIADSRSFKTSTGLQLPIKSALKSKGRPAVQPAVKLQPSGQYLQINSDHESERSSQFRSDGHQKQQSSRTLKVSQNPRLALFCNQGSALWVADQDEGEAGKSFKRWCRY